MRDRRILDVVLSGNIIEDLTYEPMEPGNYTAELQQVSQVPLYKQGGFFVFTNITPGSYTLRVSAEHFRPQEFVITLPQLPTLFPSPVSLDTTHIFSQPGDNELIVVIQSVNNVTGRVTFTPEVLTKGIPTGSPVRAVGFLAGLAEALDPGLVSSALLDSSAGLIQGDIVRLVRGQAIRMRYDPYDERVSALTQVIGRVVLAEDSSVQVAGAEVRLIQVNGLNVTTMAIEDAQIAILGSGATTTVLGTELDVATTTNDTGDFTLYFSKAQSWTAVSLQVSQTGFLPQVLTLPVLPLRRNRADVSLVPA